MFHFISYFKYLLNQIGPRDIKKKSCLQLNNSYRDLILGQIDSEMNIQYVYIIEKCVWDTLCF